MNLRGIVVAAGALSLVAVAGVGTAQASSFPLNQCAPVSIAGSVVGGCGTGPYGTVTLTVNGANVDVTVALNSGFYFTDSLGAGKALYFDLSGGIPDTSIGNLTPGFVLDGASGPGKNIQGTFAASTGGWNYAIECSDDLPGKLPCPGGAPGSAADAQSFSFTVAGVGLANFVTNSHGLMFASSIFSSAANGGTGGTGQAAYNPSVSATAVPEPSSLLLLATGLAGVGRSVLRRRKA